MPGFALPLAPLIPKITAAGAGLLKTSIGLGIGSAIGIPWLSDNLTRGAIDKYKEALNDGTESTLERTNPQGNVEMNVNPVVGLFVDEEKIDDRAKKELTRQVYSQNPLVQKRAAYLGLNEDEIGYNPTNFLARTQEAFEEKKSLEEAFKQLRGIPDNQSIYAKLKQGDAGSDEVWQAVTALNEKRRRDPYNVGSDAYNANVSEGIRDNAEEFQTKSLGLQGEQIRGTNSIAELGIIQSMLQSQQTRQDSIENRNLQLQLREFDREDRREDRLDRLDENKRKEKMAMIQMLVRGLTEASSSFGRY